MTVAPRSERTRTPHTVFVLASLALGGAESQLTSMLEAVDGHPDGLRATVLTLTTNHDPSLVHRLAAIGVPVATVDRAATSFPAFFTALVRWFRRARPVLVHTVLSGSTGTWGRLAARLAGVRVIIHSERSLAPRRTRMQMVFEPLAHSFTTRFFTNARAIAERLEGEGVSPGRIRVLRNGVDLARFTSRTAPLRTEWGVDADAFVVGALGSLRPIKRPDLLLDAVALLPIAERPDLVVFGGDGPLLPTLRARVADDPWSRDHVRFLGQVGDVPRFLAALDVLALSSDTEGLPNAIIEAMAAGVPCVATRVSDVPDLVTDNGWVVTPGDASELARALAAMRALDADERSAMGLRGRVRAESEYSLDVAAKRFWDAHREVLDAVPARRSGVAARA